MEGEGEGEGEGDGERVCMHGHFLLSHKAFFHPLQMVIINLGHSLRA